MDTKTLKQLLRRAKIPQIARCILAIAQKTPKFIKDFLLFCFFPKRKRVRFTAYWNAGDRYFSNYYFTPFFGLKEKPQLSKIAPTIEFFSVYGNAEKIKKKAQNSNAKIKIFWTGECVSSGTFPQYNQFHDHLIDSVDLAMGFDEINDKKYVRYPLWVYHLFSLVPEFDKDKIRARIDQVNAEFTQKLLASTRTDACSVIVSHDTNGIRSKIWEAVEKASLKVQSAGKWRHNDDSLWKTFANNKYRYLEQFRYNICPENCDTNLYVTEKLFQAIMAGCLPIYWGSQNNPEPDVLNHNLILFYDEGVPEKLTTRIKEIQENPKLFAELAKQKPLNDYAVDWIYNLNKKTREFCEKLVQEKGIS